MKREIDGRRLFRFLCLLAHGKLGDNYMKAYCHTNHLIRWNKQKRVFVLGNKAKSLLARRVVCRFEKEKEVV